MTPWINLDSLVRFYGYKTINIDTWKGACGVTVIIVGNGYGKQSSNPEWGGLHFTSCLYPPWERL